MAQVSVNITDHEVTPIHKVYEEVCKDAEVRHGSVITDTFIYLDFVWKLHIQNYSYITQGPVS